MCFSCTKITQKLSWLATQGSNEEETEHGVVLARDTDLMDGSK